MKAIFLAPDGITFLTRAVAHVHTVTSDEDDVTYYEPVFFYLDGGMLILATSQHAEQHVGGFLGVVADDEDPGVLQLATCPSGVRRH